MDILMWLAETEDPVHSKRRPVKCFALTDHVADARRRRKRTASDSSLLKEPSPQPCSVKQKDIDVQRIVDSGQSGSSHSTFGVSTDSSASSQFFARKRRHKTRPEKYDARLKSSREQNDARARRRKKAASQPGRRPKRRIDAKTHNGVGQTFRAGNVSKDRLTLKPTVNIGLFGKGKTSAPIGGRGLPDLVFSDLKFLGKSGDERDRAERAPQAEKKRKKNSARTKEEDISAFFSSTRPAIAETRGNLTLRGGPSPLDLSIHSLTTHPSRVPKTPDELKAAVRSVNPEGGIPSSKTGNRRPSDEITSYFSWSESVRPSSAASASASAKAPQSTSRRQLSNSNQESVAERQRRYGMPPQALSSTGYENANISVNRIKPSLPSSNVFRRSRPSSSPPRSAVPSRSRLVMRAEYSHVTEKDAYPSPTLPGLSTQATKNQVNVHVTERARDASFKAKLAPGASRKASTIISQIHRSYEAPHLRVGSGSVPLPEDPLAAEVHPVSSYSDHRAMGHEIDPCSEGGRQPESILNRGCAIEIPNLQVCRQPNLLGSGLYVQQEQQQQQQQQQQSLDLHAGMEYDYLYEDTEYDEYGCEGDMSCQEDLNDASDGLELYKTMHNVDLGYEGDVAGQAQEHGHSEVVGLRFWRPHRLY